MRSEVIGNGEPLANNPVDIVGGKAHNLFRLVELSQGRDFKVPDFYVIPVSVRLNESQLTDVYNALPKPLIVRSSSPWEDSEGYSFAGRFQSVLDITDLPSFQSAVEEVLDSARDIRAENYALQHGLSIDDRMAVIVQKMIDPLYSGVCYSNVNSRDPKVIAEFVSGLSDELMSGNKQGNIASFDHNFRLTMEYGDEQPGLDKVARVAKELEGVFGMRLDIEFAVSQDGQVYIVQARPITDSAWPDVKIPDIDPAQIFFEADIVRGAGLFRGPVFVFRSPTAMEGYAAVHNRLPMYEIHEQWHKLGDFNRNNPNGFCLLTDNLEQHETIMKDGGLSNLRALVTVDYASRFSHPAKVISETGAFYLGILRRNDLLDMVDTGDTFTVTSDQIRGLVYDLTKPVVEIRKIDLDGVPVVPFQTAIGMHQPPYEEVDDRLFVGPNGKVGVKFWDYNEENGIPTDVFYDVVDMDGHVIKSGVYKASRAVYQYTDFPLLLADLLTDVNRK